MIKKLTSHVFLLLIAAYAECVAAELDLIHPNDNLKSAGIFDDGELHLSLVAEPGMWHPETEQNPGIEVRAFRQRGKPLQTPGPTVRITEGTEVRVSIRNAIPDTVLEVHGFQSRPSNEESVLSIPTGETVTTTFRAGKPGTYFYWATTGAPFSRRGGVDSQLSGCHMPGSATRLRCSSPSSKMPRSSI